MAEGADGTVCVEDPTSLTADDMLGIGSAVLSDSAAVGSVSFPFAARSAPSHSLLEKDSIGPINTEERRMMGHVVPRESATNWRLWGSKLQLTACRAQKRRRQKNFSGLILQEGPVQPGAESVRGPCCGALF